MRDPFARSPVRLVRPAAGPGPLPGPGGLRPIPTPYNQEVPPDLQVPPDPEVICPVGQEYANGQCRDLCVAGKPRNPVTGLCTAPLISDGTQDGSAGDVKPSFWAGWSPAKKILVGGLAIVAAGSVAHALLADAPRETEENPGRRRHQRRVRRPGRRRA